MINQTKKQKAFVSIFAIFFSAVVISILTALYILLIKQIEMMSLDASSFQALYMADSAFECALYKEQKNASTTSLFLPSNSANIGYCAQSGDAYWHKVPDGTPVTTSGRASSVLDISMDTSDGKFCGIVTVGKQIDNSQVNNTMNISGQSRDCTSSTSTKVVERLIDFYY